MGPPATGTPALLDKVHLSRPNLCGDLHARVTGPGVVHTGEAAAFEVRVENASRYSLNGTQVVFALPKGTDFAGTTDDRTTVQGRSVVLTIGRLPSGERKVVTVSIVAHGEDLGVLEARAFVRSSTAQSVSAEPSFAWRVE